MDETPPTPEPTGEPPGKRKAAAKKADKATVSQRVEEVLRIRLDGAQYHDIQQYSAEKGWNLSERQLREYMQRADGLLVERLDRKRKPVIARHIAQRQALFARAVNAADYRTALAILDSDAKLRGLFPDRELKELKGMALTQGARIAELEKRLGGDDADTTGNDSLASDETKEADRSADHSPPSEPGGSVGLPREEI